MRSTQLIGLKEEAYQFLDENCKVTDIKVCKECGHVHGGEKICKVYDTETGRKCGMFDDGPDLNEYELKDDTFVREVVQCVLWSSGPCIFLCLQKSDGSNIFEWDEKEIKDYI